MSVAITTPACVAPVEAALGEGPLWDPRCEKLVFLDIKGGKVFLFDPSTGALQSFRNEIAISAVGCAKPDGYVCVCRNGFGVLVLEDGRAEVSILADPEADIAGNRFNDGKVAPDGSFWAGTMDDAEKATSGAWWRFAEGGQVSRIADGFKVTNGPAFDAARRRVFLTDSAAQKIFVAPLEGGAIGPRAVFLHFGEGDGYPDGMEVDNEGCLWVAFWDGGAIRRFSPGGDLLEEISMPAPRPTSLAFAHDKLYVTSARIGLGEEQLRQYPLSGGLFEISLVRPLQPQVRQPAFTHDQ